MPLDESRKILRRVQIAYWSAALLHFFLVFGLVLAALSASFIHVSVGGWRWLVAISVAIFLVSTLVLWLGRLRNWKRVGGASHLLEKSFPILRSDVTTAKEFEMASPKFSFSPDLLQAMNKSVGERLRQIPYQQVFGWKAFFLRYPFRLIALVFLFLYLLFFSQPKKMWAAIHREPSSTKIDRSWLKGALPFSVGGITVEYEYPEYTRFPSTSEKPLGANPLTGIRGTIAKLRFETDRPMRKMGLLSPEGDIIPSNDGVESRFFLRLPLQETGAYRFQGEDQKGRMRVDEVLREVQVIADQAPRVVIVKPREEVAVKPKDGVLFRYTLDDDFGFSKLFLQLSGDGYDRKITFPVPNKKTLSSEFTLQLGQLGLPRRMKVLSVELVVMDNDEVSGAKEGRSLPIRLRFSHPEEEREQRIEVFERWLKNSLMVLADDLEANRKEMDPVRWKENTEKLFRIAESISSLDKDFIDRRKRFLWVKKTLEDLGRARKDIEKSLTANQSESEELAKKFVGKIEDEIQELEKIVLFLDQMRVNEETDRLTAAAADLEDATESLAQRLQNGLGEASTEELREMVDELQRLMNELADSMQSLSEKDLPEFFNLEALDEQGQQSASGELSEIQKLLAEGKTQEAKEKLEALMENLRALAQDFRGNTSEMAEAMGEKLFRQMEKAWNELSELKEAQQQLMDETIKLRDKKFQSGSKMNKDVREILRALVSKLGNSLRKARQAIDQNARDAWSLFASPGLKKIESRFQRLKETLEKQKYASARVESDELEVLLEKILNEGSRRRDIFGRVFGQEGNGKSLSGFDEMGEADEVNKEIQDLLSPHSSQPLADQKLSPSTEKKLEELQKKQDEVRKRLSKYESEMRELNEKVGAFGPEMFQPLKESGRRMESASKEMRGKRPGPAVGEQREAVAELHQLQENLESTREKMQQAAGTGMQGVRQRRGGMGQASREPVLLPEEESNERAKAWWESIMKALKEKPPEGYEDLTREYFLELVE